MKNNKKGFTLIELVVYFITVTVLVGISYRVYYPFMLKTRLLNGIVGVKEIAGANERYYMIHDKYTDRFQDLDIEVVTDWENQETDDGEMFCEPSCSNPKMRYDLDTNKTQYVFYRGAQQIGIGTNYSESDDNPNKLYCFYTVATGEDQMLGKVVCNSSGFNVQDADYEDGERWFLVN